jgi:large subunit ribosomal protein L30
VSYAVVRVRGKVGLRAEVRDTMRMLRLTRANHCVVVPATPSVEGMLRRTKDYVTWGEVDAELLARVLLRHGRAEGNRPIDDAYVKENSRFSSVQDLAQALVQGDAKLADVKGLKPVLRLPPPRRGYEGVKRGYADGGALGYRGANINDLLRRMLREDA